MSRKYINIKTSIEKNSYSFCEIYIDIFKKPLRLWKIIYLIILKNDINSQSTFL